ncbi:unnamed protein product [Closterium sp. NIES-65]|nr:unnamed protein product [Closterium sp. NIES-65]
MRLYPDLNQLSAGERVQQRVKRMGGDVRQLVEQLWAEVEDMERTRMQTRAARAAGTGGGRSGEASSGVVSSGGGAGSSAASGESDKGVKVKAKVQEREEVLPSLQRPAGSGRFDNAAEASKVSSDKGVQGEAMGGKAKKAKKGKKGNKGKEEREEVMPVLQRPAGSVHAVEASSTVVVEKGVEGERPAEKKKDEREVVLPALQRPVGGSGGAVSADEASRVPVKGTTGETMDGKTREMAKEEEREQVLPALQRPVGGSGEAVSADEASRVEGETMDGKTKKKEKEREQVLPALQRPVGGKTSRHPVCLLSVVSPLHLDLSVVIRPLPPSPTFPPSFFPHRSPKPGTISNPQAVTPIPKGLPPVVTPPPVDLRRTHPDFFRPPFPPKPCSFHHSRPSKPGTTSNPQAVTPIPKGLPPVVTPPPVDLPEEKVIQQAEKERTTVPAKVVTCNHGGLVLSLNGVQAFLPASYMHPELRRWSFRGWLRANGHDPNLFGAREESGGGEGGGRGGEKWKAWNKGKEGKKGEEKEEGGEEGRMEGEGGEGEERAVGGEGVETLRVQLSEQYTQEKLALFSSYVGEVRLALFLSYVGEVRLALFLSYVGEVRLALFSSYVGEVRLALFLSYVGEEVRVRVERCDSKTRSVFVTQRGADLEDEERVERREQLQHRLEAGDVVTSTVVYIGDMNMTVQVDGVNVMIHYDSIRQLKQGPVDTWPFPIGHQARCKRSYLRHLKIVSPLLLSPSVPPSSAPSVSPSSAPSVSPLLRSLCLPLLRSLSFKPLMHRPVSASARASQQVSPKAPARCTGATLSQPPLCFSPLSLSYPARTGQSLPVHVLRRKPVQKRLLIALQPPFPVLMRSSPLFLPYPAPAHTGQSLPSLPVHAAAELEAVAASLRETPGITSVTLGRVIGGGALAPGFQIFLASQSDSDYKLVARAGLTIQEVMIFLD